MNNIKEFLKRPVAALLLLAVVLTMSVGTLWAKYAMDVEVTDSLSLILAAKYKYYVLPTAKENTSDPNYTNVADESVGGTQLTVLTKDSNSDDPQINFAFDDNSNTSLASYPYVAITYMSEESVGNFYLRGDKDHSSSNENGEKKYTSRFQASLGASEGKYVTTIVNLKNILTNSSRVNGIRLDYFSTGNGGDVFYLESIIFCDSFEGANELAKEKSAALNRTINYVAGSNGKVSLSTETVGINGTLSGSTATADSGYKFVSWKQNGKLVSVSRTLVPEKVNGMYESATYTAIFDVQSSGGSSTVYFDIDFTDKQNTRVSGEYVNGNGVAVLEVTNASDPWVEFTLGESSGLTLKDYPYIAITYMTTADDSARLFYMGDGSGDYGVTGEGGRYYSQDLSVKFNNLTSGSVSGGKYVTAIVNAKSLMSHSTYIDGLRFDYFANGNIGDKFYLDSVVFCATETEAEQVAASRSAALNCTISYTSENEECGTVDISSETIGINSTKALTGATATAKDGYSFAGWYNGETLVSNTASFIPPQTVGAYQSATYTAKFELNTEADELPTNDSGTSDALVAEPEENTAVTEIPVVTEEPAVTEDTAVTEIPVVTEEPAVSADPAAAKTPALTEEPASTAVPEPTKELPQTPEQTAEEGASEGSNS